MNTRTKIPREQRQKMCLELAATGLAWDLIAKRANTGYPQTKKWLEEAGFEPPKERAKNDQPAVGYSGIWDAQDDDLRRIRIAKKAAQGARAQLKAISMVPGE